MNETEIADILKSTRTIALVGASDKPERPSYRVMAYLLDQGYHVIPVSPKVAGKTLLGQYSAIPKRPGAWRRKLSPLVPKHSGCNLASLMNKRRYWHVMPV